MFIRVLSWDFSWDFLILTSLVDSWCRMPRMALAVRGGLWACSNAQRRGMQPRDGTSSDSVGCDCSKFFRAVTTTSTSSNCQHKHILITEYLPWKNSQCLSFEDKKQGQHKTLTLVTITRKSILENKYDSLQYFHDYDMTLRENRERR